MPKTFASWFAPACFAVLLFAAAGSAHAQTTCDPNTDPTCVVTGPDNGPGSGPHAIIGGPITMNPVDPSGSGYSGGVPYAVLNEDEPSTDDDFYSMLLMFWGLA